MSLVFLFWLVVIIWAVSSLFYVNKYEISKFNILTILSILIGIALIFANCFYNIKTV